MNGCIVKTVTSGAIAQDGRIQVSERGGFASLQVAQSQRWCSVL